MYFLIGWTLRSAMRRFDRDGAKWAQTAPQTKARPRPGSPRRRQWARQAWIRRHRPTK